MQILNKKARLEYKIENESYEAGLVLSGGEAKAVRTGHADLSRAHVKIINGEAFLINANIPIQGAPKHKPTRTRKLLLHKEEIISLLSKAKQQKLTLIPISLYTSKRLIKLKLALGKLKKKFEKRESLKKKSMEKEIAQELKNLKCS